MNKTPHLKTLTYIWGTVFLLFSTVSCNLDDTIKGEFGGVDDENPTLEITSPLSTDKITWWNQQAFVVSGTCRLRNQKIQVKAYGVNADLATCQTDGTWTSSLDFKDPGVLDGTVTITADYHDMPIPTEPDSVALDKRTYPELFAVAAPSTMEGTDLVFNVTLDHVGDVDLAFDWSTADDSATTADSDYTPVATTTVTIPAGQSLIQLTVATGNDTDYELDETLSLNLANPTMAYLGQSSASATIANNDAAPGIFVFDASGSEGQTLSFVVSLSSVSGVVVDFNYMTMNTTAMAPGDYAAVSGSGQIPAGSLTTGFQVITAADSVYENTETFSVTLSSLLHAQVLTPGTDEVATGTITNLTPIPNVFVDDDAESEGTDLVFAITLDRSTAVDWVISWQTYDGTATTGDSDYTGVAGATVTFSSGSNGASHAVTVSTGNDSTLEADETMSVSLTAVSAVSVANPGTDNVATGTIQNNDAAPLLYIDDLVMNEGETQTLVVTLNSVSALDAVFSWQTYDGSATSGSGDYTAVAPNTVTIPAGSLSTVSVDLAALADGLDEFDELMSVSLAVVSGAGTGDLLAAVTITDMDAAPLIFIDDFALTEPDTVNYTVSLSAVSAKNVVFDYASVDIADATGSGTDYDNFSASNITIAAGVRVITLSDANAVDDLISEGIETYLITISSHTNSGTGDVSAVVSINDNDGPPSIFVQDLAVTEGSTFEFIVSLGGMAASPVTFDFDTFDGTATTADSDYSAVSSGYTIAAGLLQVTIAVATGDDTTYENSETMSVTLSNVSATATIASAGVDDRATGTINNDDSAPDLFIDDLTFAEGDTGFFSVSLSQVSGLDAIFQWQTFDGTALQGNGDYTQVTPTQVTIPAGSITISDVQVNALSDGLYEASENFSITLAVVSDAGTGDLDALGTINNMDNEPDIFVSDVTGSEGDTLGFVVSLAVVSGLDVTFNYQSYDGTATTGDSDYGAISGPMTIPALQGQVTLNLVTTEDTTNEPNETMTLSLSSVVGANVSVPGTDDIGTGTINNDDGEPQLYISSPTVSEGDTLIFVVSIAQVSAIDVSFDYTSVDGNFGAATLNATTGDGDYTADSGTITIAPASLFRNITIVSGDDTKFEAQERFTVSLDNVSGATIPVAGTDDVGTGTINNDDVAPTAILYGVVDNEGTANPVNISLSEASGLEVVFTITTTPVSATSGLDYLEDATFQHTISSGTAVYPVAFTLLSDALDELNESFDVTVTAISGLTEAGSDLLATVTIVDTNSPPDIFIGDVAFLEGDTGTALVTLSAVSGLDVVFDYQSFDTGSATGAGTDYNDIALTTATVPAGSISFTFDLVSVEDPTNEPDETFDITLSGITNAGSGDIDATMTIQNDDGVVQLFVAAGSGDEGSNVILTASLSAISGVDVTFDWRTFDIASQAVAGTDYTGVALTSATIVAGQLTLALPVAATNDTPLDENDETFLVSITNAANATIIAGSANGTIVDQDTEPLIYIVDAQPVNEGQTLNFIVSLSKQSGRDLWFNWETLDETAFQASGDYTPVPSTSYTISAGTVSIDLEVIALVDTPLNEPSETLNVTLTALNNVSEGDVVGRGFIGDIDADPFIFIDEITATEGDTADLIISLSAVSAIPVTASLTYYDNTATESGGDFTKIFADVSIPVMTRVITLSAWSDEDALNEGTEDFDMSLSSINDAQSGIIFNPFYITDDDPQPGVYISDAAAVTEGATAQFIVSLGWLSGLDVDFTYNTTDDTAISPDDFTAIGSTNVTIPAGSLQTTISVTTIDEAVDDSNNAEYFNVTLTAVNNGTISVANGVGQIDDNDAPPQLFVKHTWEYEGNLDQIRITLSGPSENTIDFDYYTVDGTAVSPADYGSHSVTGAQIPAGSITYSFVITIASDNIYESTETYTISVANSNSSIGDYAGPGTISNTTGVPDLYTADAGAVTEGATSEFVVTLTNLADTDITFNWSTVDGTATDENTDTDYYEVNALTATISALSDTITLSVATNDDAVAAEGTENYSITLSGGSANVSIVDGYGQADINDNEGAINLYIVDSTVTEGQTLEFDVTFSAASAFPVTFSYAQYQQTALVSDGDMSIAVGSRVVPAGVTLSTITVLTGDDTKFETNETFQVSLHTLTGAIINVVGTDDLATGTINNDDTAPMIYAFDMTISENLVWYHVISLSEISGVDAVYNWRHYDGTATAGSGDYLQQNLNRTIPAGTLTVTAGLLAYSDAIDEFDEIFTVSLSPTSGLTAAGSDLIATITIVDTNPAPTIYIDDFAINEPDTVDFVVSLSEVSGKPIWFDHQSVDTGSATGGGTDFGDISVVGTTIPAGQLNITLSGATALDDVIAEGTETYQITLTNINNAGDGKNGATVTINDDEAVPSLTVYGVTLAEGSTFDFIVSLSGASSGNVEFDFETYQDRALFNLDFTAVTVTSTIPAGALQVTVAVNSVQETLYELDEKFSVTISNPVGAATIAAVGAEGLILNDDVAPDLYISDFNIPEEGTAELVISLSAPSGRFAIFDWQTYDVFDAVEGTDYTAGSGRATIYTGSTTLLFPQEVVALPADLLDEANETFLISLAVVSDAGTGDLEGTGTIIDNDGAPNIFIEDVAYSEGSTGPKYIVVSLSGLSGLDVTFDWDTTDGTATTPGDYTARTGFSATILAGYGASTLMLLNYENDTIFEGDEIYYVTISNITNAGAGDVLGNVTILDNDPMPTVSFAGSPLAISITEGATAEFIVTLTGQSDVESTFDWSLLDGFFGAPGDAFLADSDYVSSSGTATIPAGGHQFTIPVASVDDSKYEGDETFIMSLSNFGSVSVAITNWFGEDLQSASIYNDDAPPQLFIYDDSVNEGETKSYVISLSEVSGLDVEFTGDTYDGVPATLAATGGADYVPFAGLAGTIPAGSLTLPGDNLIGEVDNLDEYNENYIVSLTALVRATAGDTTGIFTIIDQNPTPNLFVFDTSVVEGDTAYITISFDGASGRDIEFTIDTVDGTATSADYSTVSSNRLTILSGATSVLMGVPTTQDAIAEGNHNFLVSISNALNINISDDIGIATIIDDDTANLYITDSGLTNEGETLEFIVSLSTTTAADVTFDWYTVDNTAVSVISGFSTADYTPQASATEATISAGNLMITLSVASLDDLFVEGAETFIVTLENSSANASIAMDFALGTITSPDVHPALNDIRWVGTLEGNNKVAGVSSDGLSFTYFDVSEQMADPTGDLASASYCNGNWFFGTNRSSVVRTSDLQTFVEVDLSASIGGGHWINRPTCIRDVFFVSGTFFYNAFRTTDGANFTAVTLSGNDVSMSEMTYHEGRLYIAEGSTTIAISDDLGLTAAETVTISNPNGFYSIKSDNGTIALASNFADETHGFTQDDFLSFNSFTIPNSGHQIGDARNFLDGRYTMFYFDATGLRYSGNFNDFFASNLSPDRGYGFGNGVIRYSSNGGTLYSSVDRGATLSITTTLSDGAMGTFFYGGPGVDVDPFTFTDETDVAFDATITSNPVTLSGLVAYQNVYAGNGSEARVDNGSWVAGWGAASVTSGSVLELRMQAPSTPNTEKVASVRIAHAKSDWKIVTTDQVDMFISDAGSITEGGTANFIVSLASTLGTDVVFDWQPVDGTASISSGDFDNIYPTATQTISAGDSQFTIAVQIIDDLEVESDENFFASLTSVTGSATIVQSFGVATITDNDSVVIGFTEGSQTIPEGITVSSNFLDVQAVAGYFDSSCMLNGSGQAFCWGRNDNGELGTGDLANYYTPQAVSLGSGPGVYKYIAGGSGASCAIAEDGRVFCWGYGMTAAQNNTANQMAPAEIVAGESPGLFRQLDMGFGSTCGIGVDNKMYCWGYLMGGMFEHADGSRRSSGVPLKIADGDSPGTFKQVDVAQQHYCAVGTDDQAYCWGTNVSGFGQMGLNVASGTFPEPTQVSLGAGPSTYKQVETGFFGTCGLGTDDKVYCWGSGNDGALGDGDGSSHQSNVPAAVSLGSGPATYKKIARGSGWTCALGTDDKVYCWGSGTMGMMGDGADTDNLTPYPVTLGAGPSTYLSVESGHEAFYAIGSDNKLYAWGRGQFGLIPDGNTSNHNTPVAAADGDNTGGSALGMEDSLKILISATGYSGTDITIPYFVSGSASSPADHSLASGTFTIAGGKAGLVQPIDVIDDLLVEGDETLVVSLGAPSSGALGGNTQHTVTIIDNDTAIDMFIVSNITVNEGDTAEFIVSLASAAVSDVTFEWHNFDGTAEYMKTDYEYFGSSGETATIGTGAVQMTIAIPTSQDIHVEGPETFYVSISSPSANASIAATLGVATITDDDSFSLEFVSASQSVDEDVTISESPLASAARMSNNGDTVCALNQLGEAYCFSDGDSGEFGNGTTPSRNDPYSYQPRKVSAGDSPGYFKYIRAINETVCAIGTDDAMYCWGSDSFDKMGNGSGGGDSPVPVAVSLGEGPGTYQSVSGTENTVCALGTDNYAYCWGNGSFGKLGNDTSGSDAEEPVAVSQTNGGPASYKYVGAGDDHACGLGSDDRVYCWGRQANGRVGLGVLSGSDVTSPQLISLGQGPATYTQLSVGGEHTCGLASDGDVYCWGRGGSHRLGNASTSDRDAPHRISVGESPGPPYKFVYAGGAVNTCVIASDDKLYCAGNGGDGQIGDGDGGTAQTLTQVDNLVGPNEFYTVATDQDKTCGIAFDNQLYCWGEDTSVFEAGVSLRKDRFSPLIVQNGENLNGLWGAPDAASILLKSTGILSSPMTVSYSASGSATSPNDYVLLGAGEITFNAGTDSTARLVDIIDDLLVEGDETFTVSIHSPSTGTLDAQVTHTVTIIDNDAGSGLMIHDVAAVGEGSNAEFIVSLIGSPGADVEFSWRTFDGTALEANSDYAATTIPIAVTIPNGQSHVTISVAATQDSAHELTENFYVSLSGVSTIVSVTDDQALANITDDDPLTLSLVSSGQSVREEISQFRDIQDLRKTLGLGAQHSCAISESGNIYCWGEGNNNRLGTGSTTDRTSPKQVLIGQSDGLFKEVDGGDNFTCAIHHDDTLYCWGEAGGGRLGTGNQTDRSTPYASVNGDSPGTWKSISTHAEHSCGIASDDAVYCWGDGDYGRLGDGAVGNNTSPTAVLAGEGPATYKQVAAGTYHTCGIGSDDRIYCWGYGSLGQLGNGGSDDSYSPVRVLDGNGPGTYKQIDVGAFQTCGVTFNDDLYCFGYGFYGDLGAGPDNLSSDFPIAVSLGEGPGSYSQVSAEESHTCAVGTDQNVYCWGRGGSGRLGDGNTGDHDVPQLVHAGAGPGAYLYVEMGDEHSCAMGTDYNIYCWGRGTAGRLGDGNTGNHTSPVAVLAGENNNGYRSPKALGPEFLILMSNFVESDFEIPFSTAGTALPILDYSLPGAGTLTVPGGIKGFFGKVSIVEDLEREGDEEFTLNLGVVSTGSVVSFNSHTVTIVDNDRDLFLADVENVLEGETAYFVVSLSSNATSNVVFDWETVDGVAGSPGDFSAVSPAETVTIATGTSAITLSVPTTEDATYEGFESFQISLSSVNVEGVLVDPVAQATIEDDDPVLMYFTSPGNVSEGGTVEFVVTFSEPLQTQISFIQEDRDGTATTSDYDYFKDTSERIIYGYPGMGSVTMTAIVFPDDVIESDETFYVTFSSLVGNVTLGADVGMATIVNDDTSIVAEFYRSSQTVLENGDPVSFDVGDRVLALGSGHSCAIGLNDQLYCWGWNEYGQVGNNTTINTNLGVTVMTGDSPGTFKNIASFYAYNCGIGTDDKPYCWGYNREGGIGDGTTADRRVPTAALQGQATATIKDLDVGYYHTCMIGSDDRMYCMGYNAQYQIGDGTNTRRTSAVSVVNGDNSSGVWSQVSNGGYHTCGMDMSGNVYCWGSGSGGSQGDGSTGTNQTPTSIIAGQGTATYKQLATGGFHTCGIGSDDQAYCWGTGQAYRLGVGNETDYSSPRTVDVTGGPPAFKQLSSGHYSTCGIGTDDRIYCWGADYALEDSSQRSQIATAVSLGKGVDRYKKIEPGFNNFCAIGMNDRLYCWGWNSNGGIGTGEFGGRYWSPVPVDMANFPGKAIKTPGEKFFISLTKTAGVQLTLPFTVGGTSAAPGDHNIAAGTFTFSDYSMGYAGLMDMVDDAIVEGDETLVISLGTPSSGSVGAKDVHTVTIIDDDTAIDLFVADAGSASEGSTFEFVVSLASAAASDVTFDWQTVDGTATEADSDLRRCDCGYNERNHWQRADFANYDLSVALHSGSCNWKVMKSSLFLSAMPRLAPTSSTI